MPRKIELDYDDVRYLIEDRKYQQWKVAKMMHVHQCTLERYCKKMGLKTQKTGPRRGKEHPDWKGGKKWFGRYLYVYLPDHPHCTKDRYFAYHRLVAEQKLGRLLGPSEVVHHIDGNPGNNHPGNLIVFPKNSDHLKHELTGRVPNWSPQGLENMRRAHSEWKTTRRGSKHDDQEQAHTIDHPTSEP